jgi:hypothetical protein
MQAGPMPENIRRLRHHPSTLPPDVYLTGINAADPFNTCKDLLGAELLYSAIYEEAKALHHLLNMVTDLPLNIFQEMVDAVGGIARMTGIDFDPAWAPEMYKSFRSCEMFLQAGAFCTLSSITNGGRRPCWRHPVGSWNLRRELVDVRASGAARWPLSSRFIVSGLLGQKFSLIQSRIWINMRGLSECDDNVIVSCRHPGALLGALPFIAANSVCEALR